MWALKRWAYGNLLKTIMGSSNLGVAWRHLHEHAAFLGRNLSAGSLLVTCFESTWDSSIPAVFIDFTHTLRRIGFRGVEESDRGVWVDA